MYTLFEKSINICYYHNIFIGGMMKYIIVLLILLFAFIVYYIDYKMVFVSKYKVKNKKIPRSFDEFKILHLSDWHCTTYGKNNDKLIKLINKQKADIIVATGDFIIRQDKDIKPALEFLKELIQDQYIFVLEIMNLL